LPFDQRENRRNAVFKYKARIAQIDRILNAPPPPSQYGRPVRRSQKGGLQLEEERQQLLFKVADLERADQGAIVLPSARPATADPGFWHDLETRFRELQPDALHDLQAEWISTAWNDAGEQWFISGGGNERTRKLFSWLAEKAAIRLGEPGGSAAVFHWLDLLKRDSPNFRRAFHGTSWDRGKATEHEGGRIERLCEASADYCLKLENEEMSRAAVPEHSELRATASVSAGERPYLKYRSLMRRAILTQLTINPDASDADICRALDSDGGVELPTRWKREPGDRLFFDAYSNARTRTKIETMISKVRLDMRKVGLLSPR
jgi:hypothetical protein